MRIIGGNFRGKKIVAPESLPVRPTTDYAKTGLFNILNNRFNFNDIQVLDLFAGTGSITYELLSRGCTRIHCVDRNAGCIHFIKSTLEKLRSPASVKTAHADALTWLEKSVVKYDVIFADPPFEMDIASELTQLVFDNIKLATDGLLIIEHQSTKDYSQLAHFSEARKYGNITFSFFTVSAIALATAN